jgi:glycogen debranching enzyme
LASRGSITKARGTCRDWICASARCGRCCSARRDLEKAADALRDQFERVFWCDDLSTYALALDAEKRPCRVRASNAGHCLFAGIASADRARRVAETLLSEDAYSGWGIRTIASSEIRYNPMSYHNGSVWPHDNALIAAGFARYGFRDLAVRPFAGLFDASVFMDVHRLPELFCGFHRRTGEGPTLYPVACAPQAWATASVFLLLQATLGLEIEADRSRLVFTRPALPEFLESVRIRNLKVGEGSVDVLVERYADDVGINVLRRRGRIDVVAIK